MSDEIRSTTPRPRFRYVLDLDGDQRWMVEEREFHGRRSLFFIRDGAFVRQRNFPEDWFDLSDAEVLALLPAAEDSPLRVTRRRRDPAGGLAFSSPATAPRIDTSRRA